MRGFQSTRSLRRALAVAVLLFSAGELFALPPILYNRGTVNAASLAPFGLPNAPIARGSIFTTFGENLGPATGQQVSVFPLSTTFGGVSISVTQSGVVTQAFPIYVSAGQINAVMPSSVTAGLATLRLFYQGVKSNAITIQIANSAPGVFAISSGGFGPGIVQNFVTATNEPINSLTTPTSPGQTVVIWGTGLGPVTFPDNVAPTAGNVSTPVTVTIGGQLATNLYSGRTPCCSGVDQIVATLPANVPLGCWVPVSINAGGAVSNTTTMAIAAPGASTCNDPGNPLSTMVRTPGTQAIIAVERVDSIENINTAAPLLKTVDNLYTQFYTRPASPYTFDPYLSWPPAGSCLVHQTSGDSAYSKNLRGSIPASASLSPQPNQMYNNGTQSFPFTTSLPFFSGDVGGTVGSALVGMNLLGANASFTIDPSGPNQMVLPLNPEPAPAWVRSSTQILVAPRNVPLALAFTPGDRSAPTAIVLYSYAAATNSTVEVECLAPAGAASFTIPADTLANLPPSYQIIDGSYANLLIGTFGLNQAISFTNRLASNGVLINTNWLAQSVVLQ